MIQTVEMYVYILKIIFIIFGAMKITIQQNTTQSYCLNAELSQNEQILRFETLLSRFPPGKSKLDFIIIMDRSESASSSFEVQKSTVIHLIHFLISNNRIYIHPSFAALALISFGKTVVTEFDGISDDDRSIDACGVVSRLNNTRQQGVEGNSNVLKALEIASGYFKSSDSDESGSFDDRKKILWIFYDGEVMDGNDGNCLTCETLKQEGVVIFTAAIGEWLDNDKEVNRLRQMASDKEHFACAKTWTEILKRSETTKTSDSTSSLYSEANNGQCDENCDSTGLKCACNVLTTTYLCKACSEIEGCNSEGEKITDSFWFIVGLSVGGLLLLALIVLVIILLCRRHTNTQIKTHTKPVEVSLEEASEDPTLPVTPLPPKRYKKPPPTDPEAHNYDNETKYVNEDTTEDRIASDEENINEYDYAYEKNERGMPEWGMYLYEIAGENQLKHICVQDENRQHEAWTPGFRLSKKDHTEIRKVLSFGQDYNKSHIQIAGNTYTINKDFLSNLNLEAIRRKRVKQTNEFETEDLQITKAGEYFVIGVSTRQNRDQCLKVVHDIRRHLTAETTCETRSYLDVR